MKENRVAHYVIHPIPILESWLDKSLMTYRMNFGQHGKPIP